MKTIQRTLSFVVVASLLFAAVAIAAEPASQPASTDWPQFRGPNRDGIAAASPKLLDTWPKEGPPLAWKSEWIPGYYAGGCSGPVVADGKVFVYSTWHHPVGGGNLFKIITPDILEYAGWRADLPDDLAKKIEEARTAKGKPAGKAWCWWASAPDRWSWLGEFKDFKERAKEVDAYLAKSPELEKYIKDFLATLPAQEAEKYGAFIRNRLCIPAESGWSIRGFTWDELGKLSKLQGVGYATLREWSAQLRSSFGTGNLGFHYHESDPFMVAAWKHSYTRTDTLVCLDGATGKTLWKKDFALDLDEKALAAADASGGGTGGALGVSGSPAVWGGKCYFGGLAGLYCVSAGDGKLIWQEKCRPSHASVLVANGVVYYGGAAYDAETGRLRWKNPKDSGSGTTSPGLWTFGGKTYIVAADAQYCLDLETGQIVWTLKPQCNWSVGFAIDGDVLASEGKTYQMTTSGVEPFKTLVDNPGVMFDTDRVAYQHYLYVDVGIGEGSAKRNNVIEGFCCFDLRTGELKWCQKGAGANAGLFSPSILADGKLIMPAGFIGSWANGVYGVTLVKATPEKFVPLGSFNPNMVPWAPMAFSAGQLFVRTENGISCYDLVEHGPYVDKTIVAQDKVTFVFKQTGGGVNAATSQKDIVITHAKGASAPAKATIEGDAIAVDIKDVPAPFGISCAAANALTARNGKPLPAFGWDEPRVLKVRTCFDNTIVLGSDLVLPQNGVWNGAGTYAVSGATVTSARVDPLTKTVTLTTDKAWKPGEAVTLTYPCFPVDQGEARRETLAFTARERSAASFVKMDETTSGSWKGVYGSEGAIIMGDRPAVAKCAAVTMSGQEGGCGGPTWLASTQDRRALQKAGDANDRVAACLQANYASDFIRLDIELTDEREHQVGLYCLDGKEWDKYKLGDRAMTVEAWDPWRNVVILEKQTVKDFSNGKYVVLNLRGRVVLYIQSTGGFGHAVLSGIFFDPAAKAGKPPVN